MGYPPTSSNLYWFLGLSRRHQPEPPGRRAVLHPAAVSPVPLGSRCRAGARRVSAGQRLRTGGSPKLGDRMVVLLGLLGQLKG